MEIKEVGYNDIKEYIKEAEREHLTFNKKAVYYAGIIEGNIVGFVGVMYYQNKAVLKSDYVLPEYRKQGIYRALNSYRMLKIIEKGIKKVEANLTDKSLPLHLRLGAKIIKRYWICTKVVYENI